MLIQKHNASTSRDTPGGFKTFSSSRVVVVAGAGLPKLSTAENGCSTGGLYSGARLSEHAHS